MALSALTSFHMALSFIGNSCWSVTMVDGEDSEKFRRKCGSCDIRSSMQVCGWRLKSGVDLADHRGRGEAE